MIKKIYLSLFSILIAASAFSQQEKDSLAKIELHQAIDLFRNLSDSLKKIHIIVGQLNEDLTFKGTSIISGEHLNGEEGQLTIHGYLSSYYAHYSDSTPVGQYEKFPTISPVSDQFRLNIAQLGAKFDSKKTRANLTLQFGDIPNCAWSSTFNMIQEANAGIRLLPKLWLDAGLFRTHIGLESIQPRENMASSISVVTFFEPYYLSGAKLTYKFNSKFHLQLNAFNSFSSFESINNKKAIGVSGIYNANDNFSITVNSILSDNTPDNVSVSHKRLYNDLYLIYRKNRLTIGYELNVGIQENTGLIDSTKTATLFSTLLAAKYQLNNRYSSYARLDYYSDPDEMLTGAVYNNYHKLVGLDIMGITAGFEFKPAKSSYLRIESRYLQSFKDEEIFIRDHKPSHIRNEYIATLGAWF